MMIRERVVHIHSLNEISSEMNKIYRKSYFYFEKHQLPTKQSVMDACSSKNVFSKSTVQSY